jgi:hypothetical protein
MNRLATLFLVSVCAVATGLILLLPADSLIIDLVYQQF